MEPRRVADIVAYGLTHDAERALAELTGAGADDEAVLAAAVFLRVLACDFDAALDTATALAGASLDPSPLVKAATDLAVAVCAGRVTAHAGGRRCDDVLDDLTAMLETEAAMSSGLISTAAEIASQVVRDGPVLTPSDAWSSVALVRARGFEGRFVEADELIARVVASPCLAAWPRLAMLALGAQVFVAGHLGRADAVGAGLTALQAAHGDDAVDDYITAGSFVLAAFGVNAIGLLDEAAALVLRGGGADHLSNLQIVDRLYGYEILVEAALAGGDVAAAVDWSERGAVLPVHGHAMAAAALGRIKARVCVAQRDTDSGIRESAGSGTLAALVGSDLEVIRARIIESSARADSGDRLRGIEELEDVARRADATGAAAVKRWAERELHRHGRRLRNVPGIGWDSLTATQQSTARLAAAGLRNREIAATLWVSEKTVESHVAAVLEALGTTNRVGIGRELAGEGIDPLVGSLLTSRQREVAALVARGRANAEISEDLGISEKTVEKHMAGLFERLGVHTRSAVAARVRGARPEGDVPQR